MIFHNMIKYTYKRLMYPDPGESGNGGEPATVKVDYSLANVQPTEPPPADVDEGDYTLTFDDADGISEEHRVMLTALSKQHKLSAATASALFHDFTGKMRELDTKAYDAANAALQKEWGANFGVNLATTQGFMKHAFAQAKLTPQEVALFESPSGVSAMHKLMGLFKEHKPVGGGQPAAPPMSKHDRIAQLSKELVDERHKTEPDFHRITSLRKEIDRIAGMNVG